MLLYALVVALQATSAQTHSLDRTTGPAAALVGNTIEVRYGQEMMVNSFAADGTFKMKLPDGSMASGDWVADDRNMCWITKVPAAPPGDNLRCESMLVADKKVGDTWTQTDSYGQEATVTLVAGDQLASQ